MAVSEQTTALIAVFRDRARAQRYLDELKRHGFPDEEIGMLSPGDTLPRAAGDDEGAAAAITGGAIGAFAGALATGLIPGAGPVVAAGLMAGMLGGAAVGGVVGTLISLGVPEEEAQ